MSTVTRPPRKSKDNPVHRRQRGRGNKLRHYFPLLLILALVMLESGALQWSSRGWSGATFARQFMGLFLVFFAMFKLFDLDGFADGFQMYDLVAKRFRPYAYVYPFLELILGLASLANLFPVGRNIALLALMTLGSAGVLQALIRGLDVNCACLGNILKVPLSTVAVAEDLGMAAMAAAMLVVH
jgi:uncharacterized membrane protein YfhO